MNIKRIIALSAAVLMCASAAVSCGDSDDEGTSKKKSSKKNSSSSSQVQEAEDNGDSEDRDEPEDKTDAPEVPDEETEAPTEEETTEAPTEPPVDESQYEYYKLLNEQYESGDVNQYGIYDGRGMIYENKFIYVSPYEDRAVCIVDLDTKEVKKIDVQRKDVPSGNNYECRYFRDGYLYFTNIFVDKTLIKVDMNGKVVAEFDKANLKENARLDTIEYVLADGTIISSGCIISPDLKKSEPIPSIKIKAEHGIEEEAKSCRLIGFSGSKIYAAVDDKDLKGQTVYCLDTKDKKWTEIYRCESRFFAYRGKYVYGDNNKLFDVETGEMIGLNANYLPIYGDYHYNKNLFSGSSTTIYRLRYPADGSGVPKEIAEAITEEKNSIHPINDTYYLIEDEYGAFLRTYENGEADEITVYLREKN